MQIDCREGNRSSRQGSAVDIDRKNDDSLFGFEG